MSVAKGEGTIFVYSSAPPPTPPGGSLPGGGGKFIFVDMPKAETWMIELNYQYKIMSLMC